jgi:predicted HicB family RNase H-like nuclease
MRTLSLRIPDSTHNRLKDWAQKDKRSINQFISTAVAEKLAALETLNYLN